MTYRIVAIAALVLSAGCASDQPRQKTHEECSIVHAYAGEPLRSPIEPATFRLVAETQSGLTAAEIATLEGSFAQALEATGAPSMTAAVWQNGGEPWMQTSGTPDGHVHYWASVGKLVTSSAILKLYEDGRLSLNEPVSNYIAGVPNGDIITLRMLLNHTSGLFSATETEKQRREGLQLDLANVLRVINEQPPYACPGEISRYSNTGYILLSTVIEEVTDQPYHVAAHDLVLARSAGRDIRLVGPDSDLDGVVLPEEQPNMPIWDIRQPRGAGVALATSESMTLFMRDLMSGQILREDTVALMLEEIYPTFDDGSSYGLGIMVYDLPPDAASQLLVGHSGGAPGARALLAYSLEQNSIVAVAFTGEGPAEAFVNILLRSLDSE